MALLKRRKIDTIDEKRIITGMIVSDQFMHKVYPILKDSLLYFQAVPTETVAKWALKYYEVYETVPLKDIQAEYEMNRSKLGDENAGIIRDLLVDLSKSYEANEKINVQYLFDQTLRWCKLRNYEIMAGNLSVLTSTGDINGCDSEIARYSQVDVEQSSIIDSDELFGEEAIYRDFQDQSESLFRLPGRLGHFLGDFERGWLVGISGAFKRGKTWVAQEIGIRAMYQQLKVAFFSLEMNDLTMKQRIRKRLAFMGDKKGTYAIPVFDCVHNQSGDCSLDKRVQEITLLEEDGSVPTFQADNPYRVCTACRDDDRGNYETSTWFEAMDIPKFAPYNVAKKLSNFDKMYGHFIKLKTYPRFTANVNDIKNDLAKMERMAFIPDIVIIDYADILKPEDDMMEGVQKEDRTWIALAQLASERQCLVFAPTQVNRKALEANILRESHTALWVGKLAHVDVMLAINQSEEEKRFGRLRIGALEHRHRECDRTSTITILQQLGLGQALLDSDFIKYSGNES